MQRRSYHGLPALKRPHWGWEIALYFFVGGLAGGCYFLASLAEILGGEKDRPLVRAGRIISFLSVLVSPLLLISDLGRPERFHRMLRRLNFRSPMSVGAWMLSLLGIFSSLSLWRQLACDGTIPVRALGRLGRAMPGRFLSILGMVPGFFVASYTGVLLSNTAVPLWQRNRLLGASFLASAANTSAAAMGLASLRGAPHDTVDKVRAVQAVAATLEFLFFRIGIMGSGSSRNYLEQGATGKIFRLGAEGLGVFLPIVAYLTGWGRNLPVFRALLWLLSLLGGFLFRWCILEAGKASADDPYLALEEWMA
jgi:formate-dependent nitrite reductase membrane component NrfD